MTELMPSDYEILRDPTGALTVEDVAGGRSQWRTGTTQNFGYTADAVWLRFRPATLLTGREKYLTEQGQHAVVHLASVWLDNVDAWIVGPTGSVSRLMRAGDGVPFHTRRIPTRTPSAMLLVQETDGWIYMRFASKGQIYIPIEISSDTAYLWQVQLEYALVGGYLSVLAVMLLYNAFLWFSVRDRAYAYYCFYLATTILSSLFMLGIGFQYLWPAQPWWTNHGYVSAAAANVCMACAFSWRFLGIGIHFPRLKWGVIAIFAQSCVLVPLGLLLPYRTGILILSYLAAGTSLLIVTAGVIRLLRGETMARLFVLAWSALLASVAHTAFYNMRVGSTPGVYVIQVGTFLEMVLLSFALGDRINLLRVQKDLAKAQTEQVRLQMSERLAAANERLSLLLQSTHDLFRASEVREALNLFANQLVRLTPGSIVRIVAILGPDLAHLEGTDRLIWDSSAGAFAVAGAEPLGGDNATSLPRTATLERSGNYLATIEWTRDAAADSSADPIVEGLLESLATSLESLRQAGRSRIYALGEFAAGMVHEIKNDMTAMRHLSEGIANREQAEELWHLLRSSLRELSELAEDVLDFSRDRLRFRARHVSIGQLGRLARMAASRSLRGTRMLVHVEVQGSGAVEVDVSLFVRLVRNLARNSAQAAPGRVGNFGIAIREGDGAIQIEFADDGPGISPRLRAELFVPFAQGRAGGTGIGLAFARRIAEAHGGRLVLVDSYNGGTCFVLSLTPVH